MIGVQTARIAGVRPAVARTAPRAVAMAPICAARIARPALVAPLKRAHGPATLPSRTPCAPVSSASTPAPAADQGEWPVPGRSPATPPGSPLPIPAPSPPTPPHSLTPPPPLPPGIKWGADLKKLGICVTLATAIWYIPPPAGVALQAWHLLAIFLGTIAGIITQPLPLGAVAMLGLGASMMTGVLTFAQVSHFSLF